WVDHDGPAGLALLAVMWLLGRYHRAQPLHLRRVRLEEMERPHPPRLHLEDELRGPHFGTVKFLWPRETVEVGPMVGYEDEEIEVPSDEMCLVLGPERRAYRQNIRLRD